MSGQDFRLELNFKVPAHWLYEQFATKEGIRNWWTHFCEMEPTVGGSASFHFPKYPFYAIVKILRLEPDRCVEWECVDSQHPESSGFTDLRDWVGTKLRFEIEPAEGNTSRLMFTHIGLAPLECSTVCATTWSFFLNQSLRQYLETGTGQPETLEVERLSS